MNDNGLVALLLPLTVIVILLAAIAIKLSEIHKLIKQYIEGEES